MIVAVSDHALVRFLERAGGLDVEGLRAALGASLSRAGRAAKAIGAGEFAVKADGLVYVIERGVVVTVLSDAMRVRYGMRRR